MKIDKNTLAALQSVRKENLDTDIVQLLARRFDLDTQDAMSLYYDSSLSTQISEGVYGIENLSAEYLVEDLLQNERALFHAHGISI